jgi:hypothetical protein
MQFWGDVAHIPAPDLLMDRTGGSMVAASVSHQSVSVLVRGS